MVLKKNMFNKFKYVGVRNWVVQFIFLTAANLMINLINKSMEYCQILKILVKFSIFFAYFKAYIW